uniref:Uncharacterized protein n=1 Tax=viral metagenome TaxID=1070528 RepID=A0A6C0K456_9ZZZZ
MPYIPPHLRPGYVSTYVAPKVVDYTGKVHWPTDLNTNKQDDIIQPITVHAPTKADITTLGSEPKRTKSALKIVRPITLNTKPLARPTASVRSLSPKFRNTLMLHLKARSKSKTRKGDKKAQKKKIKKKAILKTRKMRG